MASLISNEALGEDDKETTNANSSAAGEEAEVQEFDPLFQWMQKGGPTSADAPTAAASVASITISIQEWSSHYRPPAIIGAFTPSQSWGDVFTWWCEKRQFGPSQGLNKPAEEARFVMIHALYDKKKKDETWRPKLSAYFEKMSDATHTEMLLGDMEFLWTAEYPIDGIHLFWNRNMIFQEKNPNQNFFLCA